MNEIVEPEVPVGSAADLRRSSLPVVKRLVREPLLHFLLIGLVLFVGYSYYRSHRTGGGSGREIRLTLDDLAQLEILFESKWRRLPTREEFDTLVENRIREEILYREALALGLDKDDTIVKRRMAQKMQFLAEDTAAAREPTAGELRSWFGERADAFALPTRMSFRQVYFSSDARGGRANDDAAEALRRLSGQPLNSGLVSAMGDPSMFQDFYGDRTSQEIGREFGPGFALAVAALPSGSWQGPVESSYGWHLVFVDSTTPDRVPAFEEVEAEIRSGWLGERKEEAWRKAYDELRARYTVLLPVPPDDMTISEAGPGPSPGPRTAPEKASP